MADEKRKSSVPYTMADTEKIELLEKTVNDLAEELMSYEIKLETTHLSKAKLEKIQGILVNLWETIAERYAEAKKCNAPSSIKRRLFALYYRCIDVEKKYAGEVELLLFEEKLHAIPNVLVLHKYPPIK